MIIFTTEEKATPIFEKYPACAAFTLSKKTKKVTIDGAEMAFDKLSFVPDEDTINAIKDGAKNLKKVIRAAVKALKAPKKDTAHIGIGMTQLINIITANRKSKKGPAVIVFITDESDEERTKILTKYLKALFEVFGIKPVKAKDAKKVFKGKKRKIKDRVRKFIRSHKGCTLSKKGAEIKKLNMIFYELEIRQASMAALNVAKLSGEDTKTCIKALVDTFTGRNLNLITKKYGKKLAKKDKQAVKAYNQLREVLKLMDSDIKMPKVKFGYKRKKGKATKPHLDVKKFAKYFKKSSHRGAIILIYAHIVAVRLGMEVGSDGYNDHMKRVCKIFQDGFGKDFVTAATEYATKKG